MQYYCTHNKFELSKGELIYNHQRLELTPVQALGAFLSKIYNHMKTDSSFKENGLTTLTVPSDVTEKELQDMHLSC